MGPIASYAGRKFGKAYGKTSASIIAKITGADKAKTRALQKYGAKTGKNLYGYLAEHVPLLGQFKKGGMVKKTGAYILHKGEKVIPSKKVKKMKK